MKLYVAGPMRGYKDFNFPAFQRAAEYLRSRGVEVVSPAEKDLDNGFNPSSETGVLGDGHDFDLKAAILWDLQQVAESDGIYLLNGWTSSKGANLEFDLAVFLNKRIFFQGGA